MHSLSIAHRDIKMENILLLRHPSNKLTILLTDFGLSRVISMDNDRPNLSRTCCGTPAYMAPEILENKPFNAFQADVWACGISLYFMLNADVPFKQEQSKLQLQAEQKREWKWTDDMAEEPTAELNAIMRTMLDPDPKTRIRMNALVLHPWVSGEVKRAKSFFESRTKAAPSTHNPSGSAH